MERTYKSNYDLLIEQNFLYSTSKGYAYPEHYSIVCTSFVRTGDYVRVEFTYHNYETNKEYLYYTNIPVLSIPEFLRDNMLDINAVFSENYGSGSYVLNCGWELDVNPSPNYTLYRFYYEGYYAIVRSFDNGRIQIEF